MKENSIPVVFFLLLSLILVFSWFRFGLIFGGGDVGLQIYDPKRVVERAVFVWSDSTAPGTTLPQGLTAVPFQSLLIPLESTGLSAVYLQAIFFFAILFSMGLGMYFFLKSAGFSLKFAIVGGIFYMFNPYMMIQIWHRFVHTSFFFVAALPFLILFWLSWIKSGKVSSLILFLLTNLIASYLYGTIAYIVTVWLILSLVALGEWIFPWEGFKKASKFLVRFLVGLLIWILTNVWWLMPVLAINPALFSQQHETGESLVTLINISRQAIIPYSLQMINPFYLFYQEDFGKFYLNTFVRFLPWIFVGIILTGLISSLKRKEYVKWAFIFLIVLFLAKGSSSPLGYSFILGFEHFFPLGVLRNPFEKIGILLPFVGVMLFAFGMKTIFEYLLKKRSIFFAYGLFALVLIAIFLFNWRMFTPDLFGKIGKPAFVKVPASYHEANDWTKEDVQGKENQGKILQLPLTRGEDINYQWEYGYSGIEPSDLFFTTLPSISRGFNLKRIDDSLTALYYSFHKFTDDPDKILRILQNFNVRYIVLHKDVNWLGGDLFDPLKSEETLNNLYFLKRLQTFGDLVIYKMSDEYFKPKITLASNFQLIYPSDNSLIWPYLLGNGDTMITPVEKEVDSNSLDKADQETIFPSASFIYPKQSFVLAVVNQLTSNEATLNLLLTQFTKIKPVLIQNGEIQSAELNDKLISLTEKIVKILRSQASGNGMFKSLLDDYQQSMDNILSNNLRDSRLLLYIQESDMSLIFQVHLTLLEVLKEKSDPETKIQLDKIHEILKNWMNKNNFIPQNQLDLENEQKIDRQKVFKFQVPKKRQYEILMTNTVGRETFQDSLEKFRLSINGKTQDMVGKDEGGFISFGNYDFNDDLWEIGYDVVASSNLAQSFEKLTRVGNVTRTDDSIKIEPQGQYGYIENQISNARGGDIYRISFEALSQSASGFYFQLAQDIDSVNKSGQKINQMNEFIDLTSAGNNWQSFQFTLLPLKLTTQQAAIRFVVGSTGQLPPPAILIKNLKIERVLNSDIVLRSVQERGAQENGGQVLNINQKNVTLYNGRIEIKKPSFLIFSETYHPGWKLKLTDGKNSYYPQKHMMANLYGNAWYVENAGNYDYTVEFEPQRIVNIGMVISLVSYFSLAGFIIWNKFKKHELQ